MKVLLIELYMLLYFYNTFIFCICNLDSCILNEKYNFKRNEKKKKLCLFYHQYNPLHPTYFLSKMALNSENLSKESLVY